MLVYLLRRILLAIPTIWLLGTLVFLLSRMLPGSFGEERFLNPEASFYNQSSQSSREAAFREYQQRTGQHLPLFYFSLSSYEQPQAPPNLQPEATQEQLELSYSYLLPQFNWNGTSNQYHHWLSGILTGDFSTSYRTGQPVLEMIRNSIGNTFWLLLTGMAVTLALALELSILIARKRMQRLRRLLLPSLFVVDSIPMLVLALLLLVLLANPDFLQLFPVYGMGYYAPDNLDFWQELGQQMQFMALPLLALVLVNLPYITNQVYNSLQASLQANFTRTARAKGLPEHLVIRRHALRNALLPLITIVSDFIPALVSGSILVETIYAIPGIGRLLIESVMARDYPVLVAIILVVLVVRMISYALADTAYVWADPRIKQKLA
ncbi:ABC transporter permease [Pontibacter kalidii]|uniref:ABC transporter permease n=1 Tax=Pontibacter kalidii TaxID=2592049 RepID=UPI00224EBB5A|nr:ABC transporter permease [Pontibacter kalidii]